MSRFEIIPMMHDRAPATRFVCLLILTLLLPAAACSQSQGPGAPIPRQTANFKPTKQWFTLAPAVDEFSVEMPGFSVNIPSRPKNSMSYYTYKEDDARGYLVLAWPVPEHQRNAPEEEVVNDYGKTLYESDTRSFGLSGPPQTRTLTLKGGSAVEHRWSNANTILVRRVYLRNQKLYQLEGHAPASEAAAVERFVDSFTFEKPKGD